MSVNVSDLITSCGVRMGDPSFRRTARAEFLEHLNNVQFRLATEIRCLEVDAFFDILQDEPVYGYPDDAVGITGIRYSTTPTDTNSYFWLTEQFTDEWRARIVPRSSGGVFGYIARPGSFELIGTPDLSYIDGGLLSYWIHPTRLTSETAATMQVPDFLQQFVIDGMMIYARLTGRDRAAARQDEERWLRQLSDLREKIEDRSDDRRAAIRPPGHHNPFAGMS